MHFIKYAAILGGLLLAYLGIILARDAIVGAFYDPFGDPSLAGLYAGFVMVILGQISVTAGACAVGNTLTRLEGRDN